MAELVKVTLLKLRKSFLKVSQSIVMTYSHILMVMLGKEARGVILQGDGGHNFLFVKFFKIFLGVGGGGSYVIFLTNLSKSSGGVC